MNDENQPPSCLTEKQLAGLEQLGLSHLVHSLFNDKPSLAKETGKTLEEIESIERALTKNTEGRTGSAAVLTGVLRRTVALLGGAGISVYISNDMVLSIRRLPEDGPPKK